LARIPGIDEADFMDFSHLSPEGADKFTRLLNDSLQKSGHIHVSPK
jgi:hypothetical protein